MATPARQVTAERGQGEQVLRTQLLIHSAWQHSVPRGWRAKGPKSLLAVR